MTSVNDTPSGASLSDLMIQAKKYCDTDPQRAIPLLEELLTKDPVSGDPRLTADLYYDLGSAYFDVANTRKSCASITHAIDRYQKLHAWEELAQCYNILGISYIYQGDRASSIDAFTNELDMAEEHGLILPMMKAYINLATTCYEIHRYDEAMHYSLKAVDIFERNRDLEQAVNYWIVHLSIFSKSLARQGRISEAKKALEDLDHVLEEHPYFANTPFDILPHFLLTVSEEGSVDVTRLDQVMQPFLDQERAGDFIYEIIEFMEQLQALGCYDHLRRLLPVLGHALETTDYYGYKLSHSRFRIDYFQHIQDQPQLIHEIGEYCKYLDLQQDAINDAVIAYLRVRSSLKTSRKENRKLARSNRMLAKRANTDELTGIRNRRGLNEIADRLFEKAKSEKTAFGFEMIDIDTFKEVNDTYGHASGDKCLVLLAELIRGICNDSDIYCARYGGDEFVILYLHHTADEILSIADALQDRVRRTSGRNGVPAFTISQGIFNRIPGPKDHLWDFSAAADEALYQVKETGRGAVKLLRRKR